MITVTKDECGGAALSLPKTEIVGGPDKPGHDQP